MARSVRISVPSEMTEALLTDLRRAKGLVGLTLQRGTSLQPPGDAIQADVTNTGLEEILEILVRHHVGKCGSVSTSEPLSLASSSGQPQIDQETNEASWPEMASHFRRTCNVTSNYVLAMLLAGVVAAGGLWTDTVHIVVGAMVIAPGFEPILRVPFGLMARESEAWSQGLLSTAAGYAAMIAGAAASVLLMSYIDPSEFGLEDRRWIEYWSRITPLGVVVALAAGAAGAAIIAAHRSVLTAGVMIALALVPSASIVGMALASGDLALAGESLARWAVDATCVMLGGGTVFVMKQLALHSRRKRNPIHADTDRKHRKAEGPG